MRKLKFLSLLVLLTLLLAACSGAPAAPAEAPAAEAPAAEAPAAAAPAAGCLLSVPPATGAERCFQRLVAGAGAGPGGIRMYPLVIGTAEPAAAATGIPG